MDYGHFLDGLAAKSAENYAYMTGGKGADYDYAMAGTAAANGHFTDKGKLPNHPTFSVESAYSNENTPGGVWSSVPNEEGKIVYQYTPSVDMVQKGNTKGLAEYMNRVEKGNILAMPAPYSKN